MPEIFARLEAGKISSFSALHIRLAQALQSSFMDGIHTRDVCRVLDENGMCDEHFMERFGWDRSNVTALDSWRIEGVSLCYPTLEELRDLAHLFFQELEVHYGAYEMAELCPTIVYRTRI